MARRTRTWSRRRRIAVGAGIPVAVVALLTAAWALDTHVLGGDVVRNTSVAGHGVGGDDRDEVAVAVDAHAASLATRPVHIVTADATYETTAGDLGLGVEREATVEAALDAGRGFPPLRPFRWLTSFFDGHEVDPVLTADVVQLAGTLVDLEGDDRTAPVEPTLDVEDGVVVAVAGESGRGLDAAEVAARLPDAAGEDTDPIVVAVEPGEIPPSTPFEAMVALADQANQMTAAPLSITVAGEREAVDPEVLRTWVRAVPGETGPLLAIDVEAAVADLVEVFPAAGAEPVDASFDIVDGAPVLVPGQDGTACCAPDSGERILAALTAGDDDVALDVTATAPELTTAEAEALGIVAEVGRPDEFGPTTRHSCCQPRVQNIHRIADIVRGHVILPGETFSVNGFVGERTRENGFVAAPVIYDGEFTADVGGGVSQFATTLFNAALFAGLDFGEYQSHSIRIDRYPLGHEATISHPHPDLEIVNNTPYGVLLWPEYTDTSITVRMFSTPYAEVTLGSPRSSRQGNCTRYTTPRTRTYPDGTVEEDSVFAVYRPGEGVDC